MAAKISYTIGVTLHIGDLSNNEYLRKTIEVSEIDVSEDIMEQLRQVHEALYPLMQWTNERMGDAVEDYMKNRGKLK